MKNIQMQSSVFYNGRKRVKTRVLLFIANIILISCGTIEPTSVIEGNYEGVYSITHNYGTDSNYTLQGNITFEFSGNKYHYVGEKYWLPPESLGIFRLTARKLTLIDNGRHDAYTDPTLLLKGDFDYTFDGNKLVLEQTTYKYKYYHKIILNKIQKYDKLITE